MKRNEPDDYWELREEMRLADLEMRERILNTPINGLAPADFIYQIPDRSIHIVNATNGESEEENTPV